MASRPTQTGKLNVRQRLFVREWLVDFNSKHAALRAGYKPRSAEAQASALLRHPQVSEEIQRGIERKLRSIELTAEREVADLERNATFDIAELFNKNNTLKPVRDLPVHARRAINAVEEIETFRANGTLLRRRYKLRLVDKARMHELLCKHLRIGEQTPQERENLPQTFQMPEGTHVRLM
jgi:phage terminase small subunit